MQGFVFRYFIPNEDGEPIEANRDAVFLEAEDAVLDRCVELFVHRRDLLRKISSFDPPLEIHLYQGSTFKDTKDQHYFYGRVTFDGDSRIMELAVEEILKTQNSFGEVMDIVAHEMIHVLDYLDDDNGILPGWSVAQVEEFMAARDLVRRSIMRGKSVIHRYALVSPEEFIAVLGEVYFTQPDALKDTNIILFELMDTYFHPPKKTGKR